ncbi:uncharacterized protein LOC135822325 [Sycon ciliatum]|uniref:uncharacterized protein LOC135822325 n=1 Tax=Sycon ciliatum TaxID=27933 RepID=UPI0020ADED62
MAESKTTLGTLQGVQLQDNQTSAASVGAPPLADSVLRMTASGGDSRLIGSLSPREKKSPSRLLDADGKVSTTGAAAAAADPQIQTVAIAGVVERLGTISAEINELYQRLAMTSAETTRSEKTVDGLDSRIPEAPSNTTNVRDLYEQAKQPRRGSGDHQRSRFGKSETLRQYSLVSPQRSVDGVFRSEDMEGIVEDPMRPAVLQRLSSHTMMNMRKYLQRPGVAKWSVIASLPSSITFCHPGTHCYNNALLVSGRGVRKTGAPEVALLWAVSFSEYTTLNWEEVGLPPIRATDCPTTFVHKGVLHAVLLAGDGKDEEASAQQVLSIWRRHLVIRHNASSSMDSSMTAETGRPLSRGRTLQNTKKQGSSPSTDKPRYEWTKVCERKWNVYHFSTVWWQSKLIFAGGRNGAGRSSAVRVYDLDKDEWQEWPSLPEGISGAVAVVCKDQLLLVGGHTGKGLGLARRQLLALDLESTQSRMWYSASYAPLEQGGCGAIVLEKEVLLVAGCKDAAHKAGDDVLMLSDDGRLWCALPPLTRRRSSPVLAFIGHHLLCFCGESGPSLRTSVESFDLSYFDEPVGIQPLM